MSSQATLEPAAPTPAARGRSRKRRVRRVGLLCGVMLAVAVLAVLQWLPGNTVRVENDESAVPASWQRPVIDAAHLADRSGVQITYVAVTGGGGLVDLRFRVTDPDLAEALHEPATPPAVVDEKTGLVVHDLLMSHSHTDPFKLGVTYYFIFTNPGDWVQRGGLVTVLLGDAAVEHIAVR